MKSIFKSLLSFFKKSKFSIFRKRRAKIKHYIPPSRGIWSTFYVLMLCCSVSAEVIKWNVKIPSDSHDRMAYGLIGDALFRDQAITSLENNTFSSFLANNSSSSLGNYVLIANNTSVASGNITLAQNNLSMFVVVLDSTNPNSFDFSDISDAMSKRLSKNKTTVFSFNNNTTTMTRIYNVPEPNVAGLLILAWCFVMLTRVRKIQI